MADQRSKGRSSIVLTFAGLCLLNLAASLDALAISPALPSMAVTLHATSVQAYWFGAAFLVSSAVFQPTFAALSNAFGRRPIILLALCCFIVGTIVSGTSHSVAPMLIGRTIQGAGGGGLLAITYILIADLLPLRQRSKGMSLIAFMWLVGALSGPIMGAGFAGISWRWIFWFVLPFAGSGMVLLGLFLRTPYKGLHPLDAIRAVDWVGVAIFSAALASFLIAISWGGTMFAWSSYHVLVPMLLGLAGLSAWTYYEYAVPNTPMVHLAIFNNRTAINSYFGTLLVGFVQFTLIYYHPLYYQAAKGYSVLLSGVALLPQCLGAGISSVMTGLIVAKTGRYKLITLSGWLIMTLGCGLLQLLDTKSTVAQVIFLNVVSGIGLGIITVAQPVGAQAATTPEHAAMANGLTPFTRALGQTFGVVIGSAITQNVFQSSLRGSSLGAEAWKLSRELPTLPLLLRTLAPGSAERDDVLHALMQGLYAAWWCLFAASIVGTISALAMKEMSLETEELPPKDEEAGQHSEKSASITDSDSGYGYASAKTTLASPLSTTYPYPGVADRDRMGLTNFEF